MRSFFSLLSEIPARFRPRFMPPHDKPESPMKAALPAGGNRGIPDESVSGLEHDNAAEREAVFALIKSYSTASWGRGLWELTHTLFFYALAWQFCYHPLGILLIALLKVACPCPRVFSV